MSFTEMRQQTILNLKHLVQKLKKVKIYQIFLYQNRIRL